MDLPNDHASASTEINSNIQQIGSNASPLSNVDCSVTEHERDSLDESVDLFPDGVDANPQVIQQLSSGLREKYVQKLEKSKSALSELTENQRILIETLLQENSKFAECQNITDVANTMDKASVYHDKLIKIKKEMFTLHERSAKLKRRAVALQQQRQKEELQREHERETQAAKDRLLIAKPAPKSKSSANQN